MNKGNNIVLGILFMTLAMLCLSVNDVLVKGLSSAYPIWEVIFFRAFSGVIISIVLVVFFGWQRLKTKDFYCEINGNHEIDEIYTKIKGILKNIRD